MLDTSVLVSALLSALGPSAEVVRAWRDGRFELIVSPVLIDELRSVLRRDRFIARIEPEMRRELLSMLRTHATQVIDPTNLERLSADPNDDYLVELARESKAAVLVSSDRHLTDLTGLTPPILTPRRFLDLLEELQ